MCIQRAGDGGIREQYPEAVPASSPPCFQSILGDLPFSRSSVWRRKRVTRSQGGYLQALFPGDQCVEPGEE